MILISYDGSADADTAIDAAASMMPGQSATVLTVWEPFVEVVTRFGPGLEMWPAGIDHAQLDSAAERSALDRAKAGAERAQKAGLKAEPLASPRGASIADTIIEQAQESSAQAIVLGTRGLTGVKSMMLGSVSHAVLQHSDRPVLIVPGEAVAEKRVADRS